MLRATVLLLSAYAVICSELSQSSYLDVQEKFHIEWQYTDTNITIIAKVKTTGWFGIGFSPNGGMAGADIITASVVNGVASLQDRYADRNGFPAEDNSQDVQLLSGSEEDGVTTIKFTRKHNTCDDKDMIIGTDTMRIIYAISPDGSDKLAYHTPFNRGTRSIFLRRSFSHKQNIPDDAITFDIVVNNIPIPAYHTRYYCEVSRAPKLPTKHHMIKAEPVIQKENLGIVHHILLYGCYDSINREKYFEQNNTGFDCYNGNMPNDLDACRAPINAWALGGGATILPNDAGYPLGDDKSPDYFMMEIHYDNPQLISGKTDSSGIRLTMTKALRKHDVGVITAGSYYGIMIPPKVKDFTTSVFCTGDCTKKLFKEEVTMFGGVLHGHLATRQMIARQFRDGKELRTIDEDRHYDFNYQQYRLFEKTLDFKPGDDVMIQCHYNTEDRTRMTYGGLPTTSEMCLAFLYYYPAQNIGDCLTIPGWAGFGNAVARRYIKDALGYTNANSSNAVDLLSHMVAEGLWTESKIRRLEKDHLEYPQLPVCADRARKHYRFGRYRAPADSKKAPPARDFERECSKPTKPLDIVIG